MDGEQERDQPTSTAEAQWKRDTFYSVVNTIQASMKQRFEKNRPLLKSFALFALCHFQDLLRRYGRHVLFHFFIFFIYFQLFVHEVPSAS